MSARFEFAVEARAMPRVQTVWLDGSCLGYVEAPRDPDDDQLLGWTAFTEGMAEVASGLPSRQAAAELLLDRAAEAACVEGGAGPGYAEQ